MILCSTVAKATSSLMKGQEYRPTLTQINMTGGNKSFEKTVEDIGADKGD